MTSLGLQLCMATHTLEIVARAVHMESYSLASAIPPGVMANVASFSGMSGLEMKGRGRSAAHTGVGPDNTCGS